MPRATALATGVWIAGRHESPAIRATRNARRVELAGALSLVDVADAALAMTLTVEGAPASSGPWSMLVSGVYHAGNIDPETLLPIHPSLIYKRTWDLPAFYRVVIGLPRAVTFGCDLDDGIS